MAITILSLLFFERQRKSNIVRERVLAYSPDAHNSWGWANVKAESQRIQSRSSKWLARIQTLKLSPVPGSLYDQGDDGVRSLSGESNPGTPV